MAWPDEVQTVSVAGVFLRPDGSPRSGAVAFTASEPVESVEHDAIVVGSVVVPLDEDGGLSVVLLATDAAGFEPAGWVYRVDERWADAPGRSYPLSLPAGVPEVVLPGV